MFSKFRVRLWHSSAVVVALASTLLIPLVGGSFHQESASATVIEQGDSAHATIEIPIATSVSAGGNSSCAVLSTGGVVCWGKLSGSSVPLAIPGLGEGVSSVSVGEGHACAVTTAGGVLCWGSNTYGQLGDGTKTYRATPVPVSGLSSGVVSVSSGSSRSCALLSSEAVKCWGYMAGNGSTDHQLSPVSVTGLSDDVTSVSSGFSHTCAVMASGNVQCWGGNSSGQLGYSTGAASYSAIPNSVSVLPGPASSVSVGDSHSCAVLVSGGAMCWGVNSSGQLGTNRSDTKTPGQVFFSIPVVVRSVHLGSDHSCAILGDGWANSGRAECWGEGTLGELGNGSTEDAPWPAGVVGLWQGGVMSMDAGTSHTCALLTSGGVKCWGRNLYGQLGDGTISMRSQPVNVVGLQGLNEFSTRANPVIEGTAQVGGTLAAIPGNWAPTPDSFVYQWRRDGVDIDAAAGAFYEVVPQDIGHKMSVEVSGQKSGYLPATMESTATAQVAPGELGTLESASISGAHVVGETLTANPGTWTPQHDSLSYRWMSAVSAGGPYVPIPNATTDKYVLRARDGGRYLVVEVTAQKEGYLSKTLPSNPIPMILRRLVTASTPTISGPPILGSKLTAHRGTWSPVSRVHYQWYAGQDMVGSNSATLTVTPNMLGKKVTVTVTGSYPGFAPQTKTSTPTAMVSLPPIPGSRAPTVVGILKAGQTLTAVEGAWTKGTTFSGYQWAYSSTAAGPFIDILNATGKTYVLTADDVGRFFKVTVTGQKPGYSDTSRTSRATSSVVPKAFAASQWSRM